MLRGFNAVMILNFDNEINILFPKWKLEIAFLSLGFSFFDD